MLSTVAQEEISYTFSRSAVTHINTASPFHYHLRMGTTLCYRTVRDRKHPFGKHVKKDTKGFIVFSEKLWGASDLNIVHA